jgi:hypothetical protein
MGGWRFYFNQKKNNTSLFPLKANPMKRFEQPGYLYVPQMETFCLERSVDLAEIL